MDNQIISKGLQEALASSQIDTKTTVCIITKLPDNPGEYPAVLDRLVVHIESRGVTDYTLDVLLRTMTGALTTEQITELAATNDDGYITNILQHVPLNLKRYIPHHQGP